MTCLDLESCCAAVHDLPEVCLQKGTTGCSKVRQYAETGSCHLEVVVLQKLHYKAYKLWQLLQQLCFVHQCEQALLYLLNCHRPVLQQMPIHRCQKGLRSYASMQLLYEHARLSIGRTQEQQHHAQSRGAQQLAGQ